MAMTIRRMLGRSQIEVSALGMGCWARRSRICLRAKSASNRIVLDEQVHRRLTQVASDITFITERDADSTDVCARCLSVTRSQIGSYG